MPGATEVQKRIRDAKQHRWPVVLYGLGQLGRDAGRWILGLARLEVDFACDQNQTSVEAYIEDHPEIRGMDRAGLLSLGEDALVFVCVGASFIRDACAGLAANPFLHIITIDEILSLDSALENFYGIRDIRGNAGILSPVPSELPSLPPPGEGQRVAVYTCVTGGYDSVKEPLAKEENCDYFLISDRRYPELKTYRQLDTADIVPGRIRGNAEKNRWCKMHGDRIFREYRYSIYLDGSLRLVRPVSHYIRKIGRCGIALHKHPHRNCIYEEGLRLIAGRRGTVSRQGLKEQMTQYWKEGMPREFGLFECTMMARDHWNCAGGRVMRQWFEEYEKGEKRDQLSFTYILWKNGISPDAVGILNEGRDIRKNPDFTMKEEHGAG